MKVQKYQFQAPSRNYSRPNCSNTINRFFNETEELVESLSYFDPNQSTSSQLQILKSNRNSSNKIPSLHTMSSKEIHLPIISEKSDNIKKQGKIDNFQEETFYENRRKTYSEKIQENMKNKNLLEDEKSELVNEIDLLTFEIEFLKSYENIANNEENFKKAVENARFGEKLKNRNLRNSASIQQSRMTEIEVLTHTHHSIVAANNKRRFEFEQKKMLLDEKINAKNKINNKINILKSIIRNQKAELEIITQKLLIHYHNILKEGTDTRNDGLVWVINAIWNLNHEVIKSCLPSFLDEGCIIFLFEYANCNVEKKNIRKELEKIKENYKLMNIRFDNMIFKTLEGIREQSPNKFHLSLDEEPQPPTLNLKTINHIIEKKGNMNPKLISYIEKIKNLVKKFDEVKEEFERIKSAELSRINMEFLMKDYEKRYKTDLKTVISALIGKENANLEYSKQVREQKELWKKLKTCKTFNFIEHEADKATKLRFPVIKMKLNPKKKKKNEVLLVTVHPEVESEKEVSETKSTCENLLD